MTDSTADVVHKPVSGNRKPALSWPIVVIVMAEFLGTSLWFSANGVADRLAADWGLTPVQLGLLTSATQLGFIVGTLLFAVSGLADRYRASRIFLLSALAGAVFNGAFALVPGTLGAAAAFRLLTGVALAGIYPIGMKLVVSWAPAKKGIVLGWLVGMLSLGTALPHLLRTVGTGLDWHGVVWLASGCAVLGGVAVAWVGDGPHHPVAARMNWGGVFRAFREHHFRAATLGYFGHMWELYAVWTMAPLLIAHRLNHALWAQGLTPLLSFLFIGVGAIGCVAGGQVSRHVGSARVAAGALAVSGLICLVYPWVEGLPVWGFALIMVLWGLAVVADSPQFSALAATAVPADSIGSALAIMNSAGFLISIAAIELTTGLWQALGPAVIWLLAPGPLLGLWSLRRELGGTGRRPATKAANRWAGSR